MNELQVEGFGQNQHRYGLYEAAIVYMCNLFSTTSSLDNSFANLIKLSERKNDKLCSAMKVTSMASILATLSNSWTDGLKGEPAVVDKATLSL